MVRRCDAPVLLVIRCSLVSLLRLRNRDETRRNHRRQLAALAVRVMSALSMAGGSKSTLGTQAYSNRKSSPSYGFGTSDRACVAKCYVSKEHAMKSAMPRTPGPGAYKFEGSTGRQLMSPRPSTPSFGFGTQERFGKTRSKFDGGSTPGPGAYVV